LPSSDADAFTKASSRRLVVPGARLKGFHTSIPCIKIEVATASRAEHTAAVVRIGTQSR
jgi:hypothetical protein